MSPTTKANVISILERVEGKPKLSSEERQVLEEWVGHRDRRTSRLSPSDLEWVAQLSARQLGRLNKRRLMPEDREILHAMEALKRAGRRDQ